VGAGGDGVGAGGDGVGAGGDGVGAGGDGVGAGGDGVGAGGDGVGAGAASFCFSNSCEMVCRACCIVLSIISVFNLLTVLTIMIRENMYTNVPRIAKAVRTHVQTIQLPNTIQLREYT
jgi:hypothetical protein